MSDLLAALDLAIECKQLGKELKPCKHCAGLPDRESSKQHREFICKDCYERLYKKPGAPIISSNSV